MAISTTAKAGIGGSLGTVAVGGSAATYLAWDHITLYAVEREVLEKDLKIDVTGPDSSESKKITLTASENGSAKLTSDYSWSCVITKEDGTTGEVDVTIKADLDNIFSRTGSFSEKARKAKNELVKACAKDRDEKIPSTDKKVVGTLKVKKDADQFVFVDHPNLNYLLKPTLYEVEEKVSDLNVKLKKGTDGASENPVVLTVDATAPEEGDFKALGSGYSWSCEITITPVPSESSTTEFSKKLWEKLNVNLPTGDTTNTDTNKKLENKKKLVKACSKNRKTDGLTYKSVVGKLTVKATGDSNNTQFSFEKNKELNSLLGLNQ